MRIIRTLALIIALACAVSGFAAAEQVSVSNVLPQIDNSTARIPITSAIYDLFTTKYGYTGPAPMASKTHGAWLNLADGTADIIFLIAPTQSKFDYFAEKGVDIEMKIYGYDGLVFIGNESNPVDNLTSAEIRSIYSKKFKNWSSIAGGKSADIMPYIRNAESGSQRLFESLVWAGYDMPDFQSMDFLEGDVDPAVGRRTRYITQSDGMESVTRSVIVNQYSIGFNIMSYIDSEFLSAPSGSGDTQYVSMTGDANVRSGPGLDYRTLGTVGSQARLEYLGESVRDGRGVDWHRVRYNGDDAAWVSSRYGKLDTAETQTSLKLFSVDGYAPSTENFASGKYPFVTTAYAVIRADEPKDSPARRLFDWIGTDESREVITKNSTLSVSFSDSVILRTRPGDPAANPALAATVRKLDKRALSRDDLYPFTLEEIAYLRNGVFALSGKAFYVQKYADYFSGQGWYAPFSGSDKEVRERFNKYQEENYQLILGYEKELIRANSNLDGQIGAITDIAYSDGSGAVRGEDVKNAQLALASQGYMAQSDCDGVFGRKSAEAVRAYQADNGLDATGAINADTRLALLY